MTCSPSRSTGSRSRTIEAVPSLQVRHGVGVLDGGGLEDGVRQALRPDPQPLVGRHSGHELDAERFRHGGPSRRGRSWSSGGRGPTTRPAVASRLVHADGGHGGAWRHALGWSHEHAEAADHEAPDGREEARRPALGDPGRVPDGVVSRTELNALQADPPEWLASLRRNGPHTRQETARRLGISNSGLARGGVGEHLTTDAGQGPARRDARVARGRARHLRAGACRGREAQGAGCRAALTSLPLRRLSRVAVASRFEQDESVRS